MANSRSFRDIVDELSVLSRKRSELRNELWNVLRSVRTKLSPREYGILKMRFKEHKTLEQVGKVFSVTRERVRQIEAKAIEIIRVYENQ